MSRLERITLVPDDYSDEEARVSSSRPQPENSASQRNSGSQPRPSTSTSHNTSRSRGKRVAYQEPNDFENLDETAVAPPIPDRNDDPYYQPRPRLEDNMAAPPTEEGGTVRPTRGRERRDSARRRRNVPQGEEELTEVAGPPPVRRSSDEDDMDRLEKRERPKDEESGDYEERNDREELESSGSPPPHQQRKPEEFLGEVPEVPKYLTELYTVSYLIFFALIGTLARLGTQWITFYPGTPIVTPVIWANFGGSFVMGFLSEDQGLFRQDSSLDVDSEKRRLGSKEANDLHELTKAEATKRKKAIPLYIGLATGFCGSYTSFSSFARDVFLGVSNSLPSPIDHPYRGTAPSPTSTVPRNGGYDFEAFLYIIISTIALSLGALILGAQVATFADPITPRIHGAFVRRFLDPAMVVLAFGCWLGAVFLAIWPPDRPGGPSGHSSWIHETWRGEVIFALVFAPLGCLLRFYASLKLNGLVPSFPLGTFAVNMFGTAIEGMCFDLQHVGVGIMGGVGGGVVGCQALQGMMDGFCGCLTTVSTWVSEINGLKRKHGWAYAFASVMGGFCLMLVIMGSVRWSTGYISPICDTGYTSKVHG